MHILNIHRRKIRCQYNELKNLLSTIATHEDKVWPNEQWPRMKFKDGVKEGNAGGHGPIRYFISKLQVGEFYKFQFTRPASFDGSHILEIQQIDKELCEIKHTIDMKVSIKGWLIWILGIRWLHEALIEDAFDKVEGQLDKIKTRSKWNLYVKLLRSILS